MKYISDGKIRLNENAMERVGLISLKQCYRLSYRLLDLSLL
jgi:hypothetical protein